MNWHQIVDRAETYNRQQLMTFAHLAGCWHSCPSALYNIKRGALGEPLNGKLYDLECAFHQTFVAMLAQWEQLHWHGKGKRFRARKIIAIKILNKIKRYE